MTTVTVTLDVSHFMHYINSWLAY